MHLDRREFLGAAAALAATPTSPPTPPLDDDPLGVRADFPVVADQVYLNAAYIAPAPRPVMHAGQAFIERKTTDPIPLGDMLAKTNEVRDQFARFVGASPNEVGFLFATSEGENIVANSLDLQHGDNVVVDALHYESTYVLYRALEATKGIELRVAPARSGAVTAADVEPLVDRRTRLVSIAWVSHQNGYRHDVRSLAELAHAHGALLYADAVQAVGMFPIDLRADGVDVLTTGTYKWLLASYGVAPFYVRETLRDRIRPDRFGWGQVAATHPDLRFELHDDMRRFQYATLAFGPVYQLGAALTYLERVGVSRIARHAVGLATYLRTGLVDRGLEVLTPADNASSIVAFRPRVDAETAQHLLDEARIRVSLREGGTQIRVAPALYNTRAEIDRFLELAEQLA